MNGYITYYDGLVKIKVDGHPLHRFMFYTKREAIQQYRCIYNLQRKHIKFYE